MGDLVKIGIKTALIAVVTTAVIALFANIQIPTLDFSLVTQALGTGLAIMYHWFPIMGILWPIVLALLAMEFAIAGFNVAMIAIRWVMKVNE